MITHGSLFSGIGGIDLGFEWAGIETVWQVESESFCQRVLEKNFPRATRFSDVRECGKHNLPRVNVVSGGFPCQDVSAAGQMAGLNGRRSRLYWQLVRIVREVRPDWVLLENVARLLHTEGDAVLVQMEAAGYNCWPIILGAKEIGATHIRKRAWILCRRADASKNLRSAELGISHRKAAERALRQAKEAWTRRLDELAAANGPVGADAYSRIRRECHGIPHWLDRCGALGNAVVPQIPMLFGFFIRAIENAEVKP